MKIGKVGNEWLIIWIIWVVFYLSVSVKVKGMNVSLISYEEKYNKDNEGNEGNEDNIDNDGNKIDVHVNGTTVDYFNNKRWMYMSYLKDEEGSFKNKGDDEYNNKSYNSGDKSYYFMGNGDCSNKYIYHELPGSNTTHFVVSLDSSNESIEKIFVKSSNSGIKVDWKKMENLGVRNKIDIIDSNNTNTKNTKIGSPKYTSFTLNITHKCTNPNLLYGIIKVDLYTSLSTMSKTTFAFIKYCKYPNIDILTTTVLFLVSTLIAAVSTYSEISIELSEIKPQGEITYYHGIILVLSGSALLILIFYFIDYITISFTILITLQISIALYLCLKTLYEYLGFHHNKRFKSFNSIAIHNIFGNDYEYYSLIFILITIILVIIYLFTRHWILNNIFGFCLVFTILSLFHIRSFRICAILLITAFLYDVFWVYLSPFFFGGNVMMVAATSLSLPIKLEIPILGTQHPLRSCMFLGLGDLVIPGFVLKFCHRFDFLKNTKVYYFSSLLLYMFALFLSGAGIYFTNYPQPVLFYMCPVLLMGIGIVSYRRRESEIWNAEILEENLQVIFDGGVVVGSDGNEMRVCSNGKDSYEIESDLESKNDFSVVTQVSSDSGSSEGIS